MTILQEGDGDMAGVPVTDRGTWMQVGEGRIFYPLDPRPEEVFIDDIGMALSRLIRYNGLSDTWITVAQHSVQCEYMIYKDGGTFEDRLAMLMHDAAEAYIGDMIRPLKCMFPEFKKIEANIYAAIEEALGLPTMDEKTIKHYDNLAWAWEKRDFYPSSRDWPYTPDLPAYLPTMRQWSHSKSRKMFMQTWWHLSCVIENLRTASTTWEPSDMDQDNWPDFRDSRDWRDV